VPDPSYDPESVEELLEQARDAAEEERSDAQSYGQRAGVLLGFCGVIVALAATQAREVLSRVPELSGAERWIAVISLGLAVLSVGAAAVMALLVLDTKKTKRVSLRELKLFPTSERLKEPKAEQQGRALRGLIKIIEAERAANAVRQRWLRSGAIALVTAILFLGAHVAVFLVDAADGPECSAAQTAPAQIAASSAHQALTTFLQSRTTTAAATPADSNESPFPCPDLEDVRRP
jgi:heme A synthase